jgi:hypothetical protein
MAARMQLMICKKRVLDERRGFRDPLLSPFVRGTRKFGVTFIQIPMEF